MHRTQAEGTAERGPEENIWFSERRDQVWVDYTECHNEEHHGLHFYINIIRTRMIK
jgi:hypothetical protein